MLTYPDRKLWKFNLYIARQTGKNGKNEKNTVYVSLNLMKIKVDLAFDMFCLLFSTDNMIPRI